MRNVNLFSLVLLAFFLSSALFGCSSATTAISSATTAISSAMAPDTTEAPTDEPAAAAPAEKPPLLEDEDCDPSYSNTADFIPGGENTCEILLVSEVDDVKVSIVESRREANQVWSSRPTTHTLLRESCGTERIRLSKRYYPTQECTVNFSKGNRATLKLTEGDWLTYGWIRVDYYAGDLESVDVDGLSEPYTLQRGTHISEKVPLGDYQLTVKGEHKADRELLVEIWRENHMRAVVVESDAPGGLMKVLGAKGARLGNGYGELKVVTELDGIRFDLASKQQPGAGICLPVRNYSAMQLCANNAYALGPEKYEECLRATARPDYDQCESSRNQQAPNVYQLPAGDYVLKYRGQSLSFVIEAGKTQLILLGERATAL